MNMNYLKLISTLFPYVLLSSIVGGVIWAFTNDKASLLIFALYIVIPIICAILWKIGRASCRERV